MAKLTLIERLRHLADESEPDAATTLREAADALEGCVDQMQQCERMFSDDEDFMAALNAARSSESDEHDDDDDSYPPKCSSPGGHSWVVNDETDRCYCEFCGADGDA